MNVRDKGKNVVANLMAVHDFNVRTWTNKKYINQGVNLNKI